MSGGEAVALPSATTIRVAVNGKTIGARWVDSPTTRDFIRLLPLTLRMNDLFHREKFGSLPRAISNAGKATRRYAVGQIGYWPPGPDLAMFYRHDGESIPEPGIIVLGKVTSGLEALDVRGPVTVRFELLDEKVGKPRQPPSLKIAGEQA